MQKKLLSIIKKKWHLPFIIILSFTICFCGTTLFDESSNVFNAGLNDFFFRLRYLILGAKSIDDVFVHIDLDDNDSDTLLPSNTNRSIYAQILDITRDAGSRLVGIDTIFEKRLAGEHDAQLIASTLKAGNVYYPVIYNMQNGYTYRPFDELQEHAQGFGHINCTPDPDGVNRIIPLIIPDDHQSGRYIPAFALALICDYLSVDPDTLIITPGRHIILKNAVRADGAHHDIPIPIDKNGCMRINWTAPWDDSFTRYSAQKLILAEIEPVFKEIVNTSLRDKIVLVSDISLRSKDHGIGVYNKIFPFGNIHTNTMNTILTQNFIKDVTPVRRLVLLLLLIAALCIAASTMRSLPLLTGCGVIYITYLVYSFLSFVFLNHLGYLFMPSLGFFTAFIILTVYIIYRDTKEKILIQERNRLQTSFFLNIAHETKTPLTLIINSLNAYIKKKGTDPDIGIIKQNIDKMTRDMLNYMDAEALHMRKTIYNHDTIINMGNYIHNQLLIFQETYDNKNITLSQTIAPSPCYAKIHPGALDRIMNNLLDNAFKYTDVGGRVTVTLAIEKDTLIIEVHDTGIGIAAEECEGIIQPYYQISNSKPGVGGMGMGLFITNTIIQQLSGTLKVESIPGKGSTFTVTLPAYTPAPGDWINETIQPAPAQQPLIIPELNIKDFDRNKHTVLVVEDNRQLLAVLHNAFIEEYNVIYAYDGKEALQKLASVALPDIIISDVVMDGMDGYTLYKRLLKNKNYHSIPFIFITAKSGPDETIKALSMGAVDFITKPFIIEELEVKVASLIDLQVSKELTTVEYMDEYKKDKLYDLFEQLRITPTEQKVIFQLLGGKQNKEIAMILDIKERTVKYHLSNIFKKCAVQNRLEVTNLFTK